MANVVNRAFGHTNEVEEHGSMPLAGGIAQQGYQCGMLWGAALAAGTEAHHRLGAGPRAEAAALRASQGAVEAFEDREGSINCLEITDTDWRKKLDWVKNFLKGGPISCLRMSARYAPVAHREIDAALTEAVDTPPADPAAEASCSPASCAAEVIRRAGLSEEHATMAAGFAGGIGLSGGGCGALGAAVWAVGMEVGQAGVSYDAVNAKVNEVVERFLPASDYEMLCSEIVGRTFEDADDHARHVRGGGCAEIVDVLAHAVRDTLGRPTADLAA